MAILIDQNKRVLVQGITGREGMARAKLMTEYGTQVVAGVTPGRGGERVEGVPVYDTVLEAWEQVGPLDVHLVKGRFPANERLQASQIPGTIFSYPTNRFLFSGFFRVQNLRPWQQTMEQLALRSRSPITLEEREEALRLSREAIVTMLWELQHSRVPAVDPRGLVALAQASRVRTLLRRAARSGPRVPERILVRKYYQPAFRLAASGPWQLPSFPRLSASLSVPSS